MQCNDKNCASSGSIVWTDSNDENLTNANNAEKTIISVETKSISHASFSSSSSAYQGEEGWEGFEGISFRSVMTAEGPVTEVFMDEEVDDLQNKMCSKRKAEVQGEVFVDDIEEFAGPSIKPEERGITSVSSTNRKVLV